MLKLVIGNKNYSSWSLRPWLLLKQLGLPFEEVCLHIDGFEPTSNFKQAIATLTPTGKVPCLIDGDVLVWESIAIVEYVADLFPDAGVWPRDRIVRAYARRACAEMHAGFGALRTHCPMNIELHMPEVGARLQRENAAVARDVARIDALFQEACAASRGPMLYGAFSAADAFFAPVATRIRSYGLTVSPASAAYVERVFALSAMQDWQDAALREHTPVPMSELYRTLPSA
jgi:glutathione S-transferase